MSINGYELIKQMEAFAPRYFAVENDPIGLQIGDPKRAVEKVLVTLDVTEAVVDEAIQLGANWIVAHHAVMFRPVSELRTDQPQGKIFEKCFKHGINVYIAHTNLDVAPGGVNDVLAEKLELQKVTPFLTDQAERLQKLVVFIPEDHLEKVRDAICQAGAGYIGDYSHCTFQMMGTGTFLPQAGSQPYIGKQGELAKVKEIRLETVVTDQNQSQVLQAMFDAHPYEEVAYDLYPLNQPGRKWGLGRIGLYPEKVPLQKFAEKVKQAYQVEGIRFVGRSDQMVQKVAILGGSGSKYWKQALSKEVDVYITGDIDFHTAQDALAAGFCLIDPGHHVEHLVVEKICSVLSTHLEISILPSNVDTNPFRFL